MTSRGLIPYPSANLHGVTSLEATLYTRCCNKHTKTLNYVTGKSGLTLVLVQVLKVMVVVMVWALLVIKRCCCRLVMVERILAM
jgi:hypothetical protein